MANLQPEQAMFLLQMTLPALKNEQRTTKNVIAAIPRNKTDYRPDALSKTALELAWHIAAAEHRFFDAVATGEFNFAPIPRPDAVKNSADIASWYEESFAKDFARLAALSGPTLVKVLDFRGLFQLPAVAFLDIGLKHSVHHRGQLSTYLRAMGGKVPSIYGESYDSAEAKKAQAGSA
jgi:uncharacterized damage-inducible protein DinB